MGEIWFCTYCGLARGGRISCCGEIHFMTAKKYRDYHGEWPDDGQDEEPNNAKEAP